MISFDASSFRSGLAGVLASVEKFLRRKRDAAPPPPPRRQPPESEAQRALYAAMGWEDWGAEGDLYDERDFTS